MENLRTSSREFSSIGRKRERRVSINISMTKYELIKCIAEKLGWKISSDAQIKDSDLIWLDSAVSNSFLSKLQQYQKVNHFPGMLMLARKNCLAKNLNKMRRSHPHDYNFYPKTWNLPYDLSSLLLSSSEVLIVKPAASSQGKGIYLTDSKNFTLSDKCVVQEYIQDPFRIEGYKFDVRLYVLVTSCNPLRAFIHTEGLVRLATKKYASPSTSNLHEQCMHLTNYAINKQSENYKAGNDGHKRSWRSVLGYLQGLGHNTDKLWKDIKAIVIKTLICIQPKLAHTYKTSLLANGMCFEILGFDILIDSNFSPLLLEVNHTPSFRTDSPLDLFVKSNVIEDTLNLLNISRNNREEYERSKQKDMLLRNFFKNKEDLREHKKLDSLLYENTREEWEREHLGGFEIVYPLSKEFRFYQKFLESVQDKWEKSTGLNNDIRQKYTNKRNQSETARLYSYKTNDIVSVKPKSRYQNKRNSTLYATMDFSINMKTRILPEIHPQKHNRIRSLEITN